LLDSDFTLKTQSDNWFCVDGFAFELLQGYRAGGNGDPQDPDTATVIRIKRVRILNSSALYGVHTEKDVLQNLRYFTFVEPVISPILTPGEDPSRGLYGLNTLNLSLTLSGIDKRWICGDTKAVPGTHNEVDGYHDIITKVLLPSSPNNSASLHYTLLTPQILPELPLSNIYSCKKIWKRKYEPDPSRLNAYSTGDIQLGSIPERIYVYCRKRYDDMESHHTNTYLKLNKLNFQFQNSGGQLSNCSSQMLYQISAESGLQASWAQWSSEVGSVFCLDFRKNVGLSMEQYPGLVGNFHINFNVDFEELDYAEELVPNVLQPVPPAAPISFAETAKYTLYFVIVESGIALIRSQGCELISGMPIVDSATLPDHYKTLDERAEGMYGGSFASTAKNIGSKIVNGVQTAIPYIQKSLPYIEKSMKFLAPLLAAGAITEHKARKILDEHGPVLGKKYIKEYCAGSMVGGVVYGGTKRKIKGGKLTKKEEMRRFLE
jgi:hypothetical protein